MLKLEDFKAAKKRVDEVILPTHLIHSDAFSEECGNDVYIKPENLQKTGAFKIRGAYNKIMKLDDEAKKKGLIASSAGNHACGNRVLLEQKKIDTIVDELTKSKRGYLIRKT